MMKYYKVLICGDRKWTRRKPIHDTLRLLEKLHGSHLIIITGYATGADRMTEECCRDLGIHFASVPALWGTHGLAAGPIRNRVMVGLEPDEVIAFHPHLSESTGTRDIVKYAQKQGLPVRVHK